jgi:hypothetical protein
MRQFVTARTYPLNGDGRFSSEIAEFVHEEAAQFGLTREQTRHLLQAYNHAETLADKSYETAQGICVRCHQKLPGHES